MSLETEQKKTILDIKADDRISLSPISSARVVKETAFESQPWGFTPSYLVPCSWLQLLACYSAAFCQSMLQLPSPSELYASSGLVSAFLTEQDILINFISHCLCSSLLCAMTSNQSMRYCPILTISHGFQRTGIFYFSSPCIPRTSQNEKE